ncbi:MAG: EcsC family protein [Proteobacteria bacterium]|nr:EcsC family protein [Pseudomonadota bacterium]
MKDRYSNDDEPSSDSASSFLRQIMHLGINGAPGLSGARELGDQYLQNPAYQTKMERIDALVKWEERKNFTSGFLTSLGGIISMPVAIPASLGINWVLQTRMVATMAYIGGFDIDDPPVRMTIALCLLGKRGKELLNKNIQEMSEMLKKNTFSQIPKQTIQLVNQAVAARLMQVAASKGFSRLSKAIPVMGGLVGGILDYRSCKETADFAKELFQFHLGIETSHHQDIETSLDHDT